MALHRSFPAGAIALAMFTTSGCGTGEESFEGEERDEMVLETMTIGEEPLSDAARTTDPEAEVLDVVFATAISGVGSNATVIDGEVAILTEGAGAPLQLSLKARGLEPGDHAWHIHLGPCGSSTVVVIALSETEDREALVGPLRVDQTGQVDRTVEVPSLTPRMVGNQSHSLHIHPISGSDYGPSIACATI